uniref:Protein YIPF3 n=1 Tax=Cacopsylla melanoneura TaxID=428564 RepID=A0A8D8UNY4_9HEMI
MAMASRKHSIIQMRDYYSDEEKLLKPSVHHKLIKLFNVPLRQIPVRIVHSFMPPYNGTTYVHTDLLCPLIGVMLLYITILCGMSYKIPVANSSTSVEQILILYALLVVPVFYVSQAHYDLYESCAILGYTSYGHVITLALSLLLSPGSVSFYFIILILFCGLNVLRLIILLLFFMRHKNIIKLLVSSYLCIVYLLCNIYVYFRFVHRT